MKLSALKAGTTTTVAPATDKNVLAEPASEHYMALVAVVALLTAGLLLQNENVAGLTLISVFTLGFIGFQILANVLSTR